MINFALVGCGSISKRHADLLGGNRIEGARLIAVCDTDSLRAKRLAAEFSVPNYENMDEMMVSEPIDVVVVLTPSGLHAEHVIKLSRYGKDIMVEKPMALTIHEADQMIRACDEFGCRLFVIKQCRFHLPVIKLRGAIDDGKLGALTLGTVRVRWARHQEYYDEANWRGTWAMDGGVLTNQASHHIDLLEWMMGDVESVFARTSTALADIEAEDTAIVSLRFASGALGLIEATTATRPRSIEGSLSVLGANGTVVIGGLAATELVTWNFEGEALEPQALLNQASNPPNVANFGHKSYYEHVVNCILSGGPNLVDGLQGRRSIELINAIYESVETGKEVFLRFRPRKCKLGQRK